MDEDFVRRRDIENLTPRSTKLLGEVEERKLGDDPSWKKWIGPRNHLILVLFA
jgi:hypothetical protein